MLLWRALVCVIVLTFNCTCWAKESICLTNGFCLQAESHSQQEQTFVLRVGTGSLEFPSDEIASIEVVPNPPTSDTASAKSLSTEMKLEDMLTRAALDAGLEPELVRSIAKVESAFRQDAISSKGARGLMQLMPQTALEMGVDASVAQENVKGGAKYLRELLLRYHGEYVRALAAYNAGPAAVRKFGGVPPYAETRQYIIKVLREYEREQRRKSNAAVTLAGAQ